MSDSVQVSVSVFLPDGSSAKRTVVLPVPEGSPHTLRVASEALSTAAGDVVAALQLPDPTEAETEEPDTAEQGS